MNSVYIQNVIAPNNSIISSSAIFPDNSSLTPPFPGAILLSWGGVTGTPSGPVNSPYNLGETWINTGYSTDLYPI